MTVRTVHLMKALDEVSRNCTDDEKRKMHATRDLSRQYMMHLKRQSLTGFQRSFRHVIEVACPKT